MKILSAVNYQNKKQKSFKGSTEETKALLAQITKSMKEFRPTVNQIKEGLCDLKPASTKVLEIQEFKPGILDFNSSYGPHIDFYEDTFTSLVKEKSPLLKNAKAMKAFSNQIESIAKSATQEGQNDFAQKSLFLLRKLYTYLYKEKNLVVKKDVIKIIDKRIMNLYNHDAIINEFCKSRNP